MRRDVTCIQVLTFTKTTANGESPPGRQSPCLDHRATVQYWRWRNSRCAVRAALPARRCAGRSGARAWSAEPGCVRPRDTSAGCPLSKSIEPVPVRQELRLDRKSTRLNSSHTVISYAVFCLKKKIDIIEAVWCEAVGERDNNFVDH